MATTALTGSQLIAQTLKSHQVDIIFGIVGIPVIEVAQACIDIGIRFIGFRNEQSAAYAAAAYGYLTGRPGVCLVVGGPGVVHAMAGTFHSSENTWPLLLLAGSSESFQQDMGAFQELDQVGLMKPHVKFAARPAGMAQIPYIIEKAFRTAFYGKPGPCYVDLPADYIQGNIDSSSVSAYPAVPNPTRGFAPYDSVAKAVEMLKGAKSPLIVIGKGAQYSRAESEITKLLTLLPTPFLPTPMGKGLIPDTHPLCISAARSTALAGADIVLILGARLNWILHYGQSPKWRKEVKFIRVDLDAEGVDDNRRGKVSLVGDVGAVVGQMCEVLEKGGAQAGGRGRSPVDSMSQEQSQWYKTLVSKAHFNAQKVIEKSMIPPAYNKATKVITPHNPPKPLTYHQAFNLIKPLIPLDHIFVSEGANTMDIARSMFDVHEPRSRLDAGTQATMGVGMGYCIAAALYAEREVKEGKRGGKGRRAVVAVVGDSAFGFSGMEIETAARNKLGMLIVVMNNGGVYKGMPDGKYESTPLVSLPPTALLPEVRYDQLAQGLGGKGYLVRSPEELQDAVKKGVADQEKGVVSLVNVLMDSGGEKKLEFGWLASTKQKAKL